MKKTTGTLLSLLFLTAASAQTAAVTNVTAAQRTDGSKIVDIYYDLAEDTLFTYFRVGVEVSFDDGAYYNEARVLAGDAGHGVTAGTGRHIEWNLGSEFGGIYSDQTKVRVTATGSFIQVDFDFVVVAAGDFTYGASDETRTIAYDYEIMRNETTNADYTAFLIAALEDGEIWLNGSEVWGYYSGDERYGPGDYVFLYLYEHIYWNGTTFVVDEGFGDHPVVNVTWFGANAFADYYALRLPTDEEWEKAARGNTGWDYPWGESIDGSYANYQGSGDPYDNGTTPVGFYDGTTHDGFTTNSNQSSYGAYDLAGNVFEWTDSWYSDNSDQRTVRGGAWDRDNYYCRSYEKVDWYGAVNYANSVGFRCVRTVSATRAKHLLERNNNRRPVKTR